MTNTPTTSRFTGILPTLPTGARIMLTAFLAIIGSGYLVAVANIYSRHQLADGKEGVSLDDLRAVYSGTTVAVDARELPSRMLTMIRGEMRQYFSSDASFSVLETWLKEGGSEAGLTKGEGKAAPKRVLLVDCMRCHAQSTETRISKEAPFGPDEFTIDYGLISRFVSASKAESPGKVRVPPQYTIPRLVLVSHQHMLAIPMFTLIVGLLFMTTRLPPTLRGVMTPIPMIAVLFDLSGWWLARVADPFVLVIAGAGGLFALSFGFQIFCVLVDLWRPQKH